jgi:hypothetical protein
MSFSFPSQIPFLSQLEFIADYNYLCTYDLYGHVRKVFDAARYIVWGSGGWESGAGNHEFCGPLWNCTSR